MALTAKVIQLGDYAPKPGEYSLLLAELPKRDSQAIGVLLLDPAQDALHIRLRRDWDAVGTEEEAEVLEELEDYLETLRQERGGLAVLRWLESEASLALRITDREAVTVRNFERTLNDLYRAHVPSEVRQFRTHLPRYSLQVAAGLFRANTDEIMGDNTAPEEWIETPQNLKLYPDMFVARIYGQSMEPDIPDGSLCVFRHFGAGSRMGKRVLVRGEGAADQEFTVKRYKSEKVQTEDSFRHTRIRLESLNPAFPSWDLDNDEARYKVIAEFVQVLD